MAKHNLEKLHLVEEGAEDRVNKIEGPMWKNRRIHLEEYICLGLPLTQINVSNSGLSIEYHTAILCTFAVS